MKKRGKKGQITLFLLISVLILLLVMVILFLFFRKGEIEGEGEVKDKTQIVYDSQEIELVKYVQACLNPISLRALEIVRLQGGYIDPPTGVPTIDVVDQTHFHYVTEENGMKVVRQDLTGTQKNTVPYWITPDNQVIIPKVDEEIKRYIEENIIDCVGDFAPFRERGFTPTVGTPTATVTLGEQVLIELNFPIRMSRSDIDYTTEDFFLKIPINWDLLQDMAMTIVVNEILFNFLEKNTVEVISRYASVDENSLPPLSGSRQDCDEVTWEKPEVKEDLKELIEVNWHHLHINNTRFYRQIRTDPIDQGFYDSFILPIWDKQAPLLMVDFKYNPEWDFDFDIFPSQGNTIKPHYTRSSNPIIGAFCHVEYEFYYDVRYPTLVKINDLESASINWNSNLFFPYDGYEFWFPIDTYVCGNNKRKCVDVEWVETDMDAAGAILPPTYFCEMWNRKSKNQTILIKDKYSGLPVEKASIDYRCGNNMDLCYMGTTNSSGMMMEEFPQCDNGEIIVTKTRYMSNYHTHSISPTTGEQTIELDLEPYKPINVSILLYGVKGYAYQIHNTSNHGTPNYDPSLFARPFDRETAMLRFSDDVEYSAMLLYPENITVNLSSATYITHIMITGNITAVPYTIQFRGTTETFIDTINGTGGSGVFTGEYLVYSETDRIENIPDLTDIQNMTFHLLPDYFALSSLTARDVHDSQFNSDKDISVEILEKYNVIGVLPTTPATLICDNMNVTYWEVSGRIFEEYDKDLVYDCINVTDMDIPYATWNQWFGTTYE